jgi:hypothetical protein
MKNNDHPSLYFSAYPLKAAIPEGSAKPSSGQSPYLKSILSAKTQTASRVRVFPMANPYKNPYNKIAAPVTTKAIRPLPHDIALTAKEWFNNYE